MSEDPFTPAELEAACDAAESALPQLVGWPDPAYMAAALRAVAPLIAARVRAEVAEAIAQAIDAQARVSFAARGPAYRDAAAIARAHRTTPGDDDA